MYYDNYYTKEQRLRRRKFWNYMRKNLGIKWWQYWIDEREEIWKLDSSKINKFVDMAQQQVRKELGW